MSEKAPRNQEHLKSLAELEKTAEHLLEQGEKAPTKPEKDSAQTLVEARRDVAETTQSETQVNPLDKLQAAEKASEPQAPAHVNQDLAQATLQRELTHIRRHLSAPQKRLSKIIHRPVVSKVSEVSGKTIGRPSGMLGGGILAFVGCLSYLYLANHQGFRYNYGVFLVLFIGGFVLGVVLEMVVWTVMHSRRRTSN